MHSSTAAPRLCLDQVGTRDTIRVLVTGSWSREYPEDGVLSAFRLLKAAVTEAFGKRQPVVIVHGKRRNGVDNLAEKLAPQMSPWWKSEPHRIEWRRCSSLCGSAANQEWHFGDDTRLGKYCPNAHRSNNQRMVDLHHNPNVGPYSLCLALPYWSWGQSDETYDCYCRAYAAGIRVCPLNPVGEYFVNRYMPMGRRK